MPVRSLGTNPLVCTIPPPLSSPPLSKHAETGAILQQITLTIFRWRRYADLPNLHCRGQVPHLEAAVQASFVFGSGYFHFLLDAVPRLLLMMPLPAHASLPILVPSDGGRLHPFISALLGILDYDVSRIVHYLILPQGVEQASCQRFTVGRLHVIDWWRASSDPRLDTQHLAPRRALRLLRSALAGRARAPRHHGQRVMTYVSRSRAEDRRVEHEEALLSEVAAGLPDWALLVRFGDCPSPQMRETIQVFASSQVVVGMHGAGLSNAVFMPVGLHSLQSDPLCAPMTCIVKRVTCPCSAVVCWMTYPRCTERGALG